MNNAVKQDNAVAAIRISSVKQGLQGDSPEAQREQIERFAQSHNIHIKKYFVFIESASREQQPIQEAIDYCKNPKNDIQLFVIKSIDRFTRGGSYLYDHLKMQLTKYGVKLVDIYGVIGTQEVNTLEHLDISYNWSVYSPTKKAEILEAERAKDEMRDIMTRMIGAEIRYVRMGYRVRQAPFGYVNEKVETQHGKRVILKPHPEEAHWIEKMYELRIRGTLTDNQIVEEINKLGFKTRIKMRRNSHNRKQIVGQIGGKKLDLKHFWRLIQNPIYAGFNIESWTNQQIIKGHYDGIVSIETFNKANKGKHVIVEEDGGYRIDRNIEARYLVKRGVRNADFPYKRYVLCPHCEKPLFGSASRGKMGKYYPAYHCNKRGHYYRVAKKDFNDDIYNFVKGLHISQEYIDELMNAVVEEWNKRQITVTNDKDNLDKKIAQLQMEARLTADKIKMLSSETAIKYMEADLVEVENKIKELTKETYQTNKEWIDIEAVKSTVKFFLEHLEELLLEGPNSINRAAYFGLIFNTAPTHTELVSGTPDLAPFVALKDDFQVSNSHMVTPRGFEPLILRMKT